MTPYKSQAADNRQSTWDRRRLRALPVSLFGEECYVATGGQRIRVNVRWGTGVPLVLCNGIGASLEVLDPLVEQLDPDTTVVRFDVPGTGGSPTSLAPYGFPYLAWVLGRVLSELGISVVDVLGLSWGGALAQQFAGFVARMKALINLPWTCGAIASTSTPCPLRKVRASSSAKHPAMRRAIISS